MVSLLSLTLFTWSYIQSFAGPYYRNMIKTEKIVEQTNATFSESYDVYFQGQEILYLDAGVAAFYVDAPSYSRYFFNLPLQRWQPGKAWECEKEQYNLLMDYSGKYILYSDWMNLEKYPELQNKVTTEYHKVEGEGLVSFGAPWDPFNLADSEKTGKQINIFLFERNDST